MEAQEKMSLGRPFVKGMAKLGGRVKGSRNKISEAFLHDLAAEWAESGPGALKVMAKEEPGNFVKVVAALLPKEFEITDSRLNDMSDDELDLLINEVRARVRGAFIGDAGNGEKPTAH
jgi:hypothetical protein